MEPKFVPPAQREDDLSEWKNENDVPNHLRDLPRYFHLREKDWGLPFRPETLIQRLEIGTDNEKKEAQQILHRMYFAVLNLMLFCSGYEKTIENELVNSHVREWETHMLVGNPAFPRNFGNQQAVSRQPDQKKFATPNHAYEGRFFRMLDYKNNFLTVVKAFKYYEPDEEETPEVKYKTEESKEGVFGRRVVKAFMEDHMAETAQ